MSVVYVKKTERPEDVKDLLSLLNPDVGGRPVFIKPNVVVPAKRDSGIVTDPCIVKAIVEYLRGRGVSKFLVGESPGIGVDVGECFKVAGYDFLKREEGVELLSLNEEEKKMVRWRFGEVMVPRVVLDSYYINVAKLKTHMNTTVTLGLKNQKGLIDDKAKKDFHRRGLDEPIAEFAKVVKPDLTVVDGIMGLEGDGPLYSGKKINSKFLVAGEDIVGVDATCCRLMRIKPEEVDHIRIASRLGVGEINPEVKGAKIDDASLPFSRANERYFKLVNLYNWRNKYACSMCSNSLYDAFMAVKGNPTYWIKYGPKLAYLILVKGVNFVSGGKARMPEKSGEVICFGNCTKKFAEDHGLLWVPGCPPKPDDILKKL